MNSRVFLILFTLIQKSLPWGKDDFTYGTRFKSVKCWSDQSQIHIKYCNLQSYSRKIVALNLGYKFIKPLRKPFTIQMIQFMRYGTIFRPVIESSKEWCGIMSGEDSHPIFTLLIDQLKTTAANLFHLCPYEGEIDLKNVTIDDNVASSNQLVPNGIYRTVLSAIKNKKTVTNVSLIFEIKSGDLDFFG
jgi:hypothetical protein